MSHEDELKKLRELIKDIRFAMLTTIENDGSLRSRPMASQEAEFDGHVLWFFTYDDSPKAAEVRHDNRVNVSFADNDNNRWVSVSSTAELVHDRAKMEELYNPFLKTWFPQGLDTPNIALLCVETEQTEYWDTPSSAMVHLFGVVKATVTGTPPDPDENVKLDLTTAGA